jgi:electron transfer flavoprotein alpha subunit
MAWEGEAMILVHLETRDGYVAAQGHELLDIARRIAGPRGGGVTALVLGPLAPESTVCLAAADRLIHDDRPSLAAWTAEAHGKALAAVIDETSPDAVLTAYTTMGMDLAPYVAASTGRALIAPCLAVEAGDTLTATAAQMGGRITLRAEVPYGAILSVSPGAGNESAGRLAGTPAIAPPAAPAALANLRMRVLSRVAPDPDAFDLTRSERIFCVGRGLGSIDALAGVEALAAALGADIAGSRPVIDAGWLPKVRQVGKSGVRVAPKLYIAFGVSGAPEHLEGMAKAELIIAINSDPAAPIFETAHLGAVTDLFPLVAELALLAGR